MLRLRAGDDEAFTLVFRRWQGPLYRFGLHMSGNAALAEDATQEVFMTLIRQTAQFDATRGTLGAFLFGIARNQVMKRLTRERLYVSFTPNGNGAHNSSESEEAAPPLTTRSLVVPPADPVRTETIEQVRQAILALPPDHREVVALCDLEELSYEEAAAALGCAVGTVASRLHRARAILAAKLRKFHAPRATQAKASAS